jgi:hypothetical protein
VADQQPNCISCCCPDVNAELAVPERH